ncbi:hypothetical protein GQX73_g1673 [Xylaria multiplex]|uniref:Uncharacterized protein n=1 Tax=Xylaria multiplex TaxID=323545 RepID=A0A7C8IWK1_9PEZI|nr:hypothetical protein GQX73_g1673 [Xylaria multiplex]
MAEPSSTESDTIPKKYHQHPLFFHLDLDEAIRQGLAVPIELDCEVANLGRDNRRWQILRPAQSIADFRQHVPMATTPPGYGLDDSSLIESPIIPRCLETIFEATNDSGNRPSPNSAGKETTNDIKNKIHLKSQASKPELKDRLGLHDNSPTPTSKGIRKENIAPILLPGDENNRCHIEKQGLDTEQTASTVLLLSSPSTKIPSPGQPQSQEHLEPRSQLQSNSQATPKPTQAGKQEGSSMKTPQHTSAPRTPTYSLFPHCPATPTRIQSKAQQSPHGRSINTPLLPLHLRPENQYSPRPSPDAGPRISFATTATVYNEETKSATQVPLKMPGENKISHKASKDQGISHHNPDSTYNLAYLFIGKIKLLETNNIGAGRVLEDSKRYSGVRDFSLPFSVACPNGLVNPYDVEFATKNFDMNSNTYTNNTDTDTDTATATAAATATIDSDSDDDTGGWLALHKRRHQRAIARYLAAAAASEESPSQHASANVEPVGMENETQTFGTDSTTTKVSVASVASSDHPTASTDSERLPKASFLGRCGKALTKKRSFWKKKKDDDEN